MEAQAAAPAERALAFVAATDGEKAMTARPQSRVFVDSVGYWRLETDCGPCVRIVDVDGGPVTERVYPQDVGLPRYCDDFNAALDVVAGEAARRAAVELAGGQEGEGND